MKIKYFAAGLLALGLTLAGCSEPATEAAPVATVETTSEETPIPEDRIELMNALCYEAVESPISYREPDGTSRHQFRNWTAEELETTELETTYLVHGDYISSSNKAYEYSCTVDYNLDAELATIADFEISPPPGEEPFRENMQRVRDLMRANASAFDITDSTLTGHCALGISDDFPEVGSFHWVKEPKLSPSSKDDRVYRAQGAIVPRNPDSVWWESADYKCTVLTDGRTIRAEKAEVEPHLFAPESLRGAAPEAEVAPVQEEAAPVEESIQQPPVEIEQAPAEAPVRGFTGAPGSPIVEIDKTISHCGDPMMYETGTTFFTDGTTAWTETCSAQMLG